MNEQSEILIDLLIDSSSKKQNVDLYRRIGLCSLDIICGNNFFKVKINYIGLKCTVKRYFILNNINNLFNSSVK